MDQKKVVIERLVYEGYGLGRIDGQVILVPFSAPGDHLEIKVTSAKKRLLWGNIIQILNPSQLRSEPFCPHFTQCGGCQWQHLSYSAQIQQKQLVLQDSLRHLAGIGDLTVKPCIASPKEQGYRHRVRLHWSESGPQKGLGFYQTASHDFVPIKTCPLLPKEMNLCIDQLSVYLREHPIKGLTEIQLVQGDNSQISLSFKLKDPKKTYPWAKDLQGVSASAVASSKKYGSQLLWGSGLVQLKVNNWNFQVGTGAFLQANLSLLPGLIEEILRTLTIGKEGLGVELYAGVGLFSLPLASQLKKLIAVEWNSQAVKNAIVNQTNNQVKNAVFYSVSAEEGFNRLALKKIRPELLLLDPPRAGLSRKVCQKLLELSPKQIIYVSCNPSTLSRDLKIILETGQYQLAEITPLDMFPQTYHIETVVSLIRR